MPLPEYRWKRQLQKEEVVLLQEGKEKFELRSGLFENLNGKGYGLGWHVPARL